MDVERAVRAALEPSPLVRSVRLVGSRSRGVESPLSDWDFLVDTDDFDALAPTLPELVAPLEPLGQLWDPLSEEGTYYMLILRGPVKVDLAFDRPPVLPPPWVARAETLPQIDAHFWDWTLWLASKREKGHDELVRAMLPQMFRYLLSGLGVEEVPQSLENAVELYVAARERAEQRLGVEVPRALGDEVAGAVTESAGPRSRR